MTTIEAIMFDDRKVVLQFHQNRLWHNLSSILYHNPQDVEDLVKSSGFWGMLKEGQIEPKVFMNLIFRRCGVEEPYPTARFENAWGDVFDDVSPIESILADLRQAGIPMYLISNTDPITWAFMAKLDVISRYFPEERRIRSHLVHARKPDVAIFDAAISAANVPPASILYFDNEAPYVDGAKRAGMNAELFNARSDDEEKMRSVIREYGLLS